MKNKLANKQGFTLIELLVVIAVLGVLAAVILVAINPIEQLARGRDSGRKTTVGQLSNALQAYYTSHNGVYITNSTPSDWVDQLVAAGEIKSVPGAITYTLNAPNICTTGAQNQYCYLIAAGVGGQDEVIVFTSLESASENSKCPGASYGPDEDVAYFLWSSTDGRGGVVCTDGTDPAAMTGYTYYP